MMDSKNISIMIGKYCPSNACGMIPPSKEDIISIPSTIS